MKGHQEIAMEQGLEGKNAGKSNEKMRTAILFKKVSGLLKFESFGEQAKYDFDKITKKERKSGSDVSGYVYFDRFKMSLYREIDSTEGWKDPIIKDVTGKHKQPALFVVSECIKYMKSRAVKRLRECGVKDPEHKILWVLTIPAIWPDPSKDFMLRAAAKAGIPPGQVKLCLEPEAAAICCIKDSADLDKELLVGSKYLILDCGGGTLDVTAHKVVENDTNLRVKEIRTVNGGDCGSTYIDKAFQQEIGRIIGESKWEKFKSENPDAVNELLDRFEACKRSFTDESTSEFVGLKGKLAKKIPAGYDKNGICYDDEEFHLEISGGRMAAMFEICVRRIVSTMTKELRSSEMKGCQYVFMAGGFSSSPYLRKRVQAALSEFRDCKKLIAPFNFSMAILKGAVMLGLDPSIIASRRARCAYAISYERDFKKGDDESHSYMRIVKGVLLKKTSYLHMLVMKDQDLEVGHVVNTSSVNVKDGATSATNRVYKCLANDVLSPWDKRAILHGKLEVTFDKPYDADEARINTKYRFGGEMIRIESTHVQSGKSFKTELSFE
mmetsp:Transcript_22347/g.43435  ORF Transcript_22347/g.43435 Transcript_22347/m.43435 type:complete len:553 (-) Transcript_22347:108-1766(-)